MIRAALLLLALAAAPAASSQPPQGVTTNVRSGAGLYAANCAMLHRRFEEQGANWPRNPIGTGPFQLTDYHVSRVAVFKRHSACNTNADRLTSLAIRVIASGGRFSFSV